MTAPARRLILLGSTGSIGRSTLDVVRHLHERGQAAFEIVGLAAGTQGQRLREQAAAWSVDAVALADAGASIDEPGLAHVFRGPDAALELIETVARPGDLVLAAMVGAAGLPATLAAIDRGCDVAIANKETLVAAGELVMPRARERGVHILPVDSEHSAIAQCLRSGRSIDEVKRLVLTASGGPFRTWCADRMAAATASEALDHPTWSMGPKVTIDSATMMNKGLEVVEAHWLFALDADRIEVIVHPQSVVHSFVEFVDGSVLAQLGPPDMRTPIQYALTWPARLDASARTMDWNALRGLDFEPVDERRFPAVALALDVVRRGGTSGATFNAANEVAVAAFLEGRIPFPMIGAVVGQTIEDLESSPIDTLADVLAADEAARAHAAGSIGVPGPSLPSAVE